MKSQWSVSRTVAPRSDGQQRGDYAYQFLLRWVLEPPAGGVPAAAVLQEDQHGNRLVCTGFDEPPAAGAND